MNCVGVVGFGCSRGRHTGCFSDNYLLYFPQNEHEVQPQDLGCQVHNREVAVWVS